MKIRGKGGRTLGRRGQRAVPVRVVGKGMDANEAPKAFKPRPSMTLHGKAAAPFLKNGRVGGSVTATVRGKLVSLGVDEYSPERTPRVTLEVTRTSVK